MNLRQFFTILRARWGTVATIFLSIVVLTAAWLLLRPSEYTARAPVLVDVNAQEVGGGYSPALLSSYLATQMDVARSDRVAERVLTRLQNEMPAGLQDESFKSTTPEGQRRELLERLQERLSVKPARESNIINIAWTGKTPTDAARVANAFAQAYVETALDLKTNPAKQESAWFDEQVRSARQRLEQAQTKLSEFQQRAGIVGEEMADHEMARLTTLATQLAQVQAQTTDALSKRGSGGTVAEVMQSPLINGLKADISRVEAQLQQSSATLGPRHPQILQQQAELQSLRSRMDAETGRISTSINTSLEAGRIRERELQAALNAQRQRVLGINRERGTLSLLRQDVQAAQQAFNQVSENASKTQLASLTTMTNLRPLSPAVEPTDPAGPSKRQTLGIAAAAALLLAIAGALLLELLNRRVRSADDLAMAAQLPVLGSVPAVGGGRYTALPPVRHRLAYNSGSAS